MTNHFSRQGRRGFALITVLWVMTLASVVGLAGALAGRTAVSAARNRVQADKALWAALGCARRIQAAVDDALEQSESPDEAALVWRMLDKRVSVVEASCDIRLEAAGAKLDVNSASDEMVYSLARGAGHSDVEAHDMAEALADWRDTDDDARPAGAERHWYSQSQRSLPRNGPLADLREVQLVRGFEQATWVAERLSAEAGRVSLAHASAEVLDAVPGVTRETADLIGALARAGTPVRDLALIVGRITVESAESLMTRYPEITRVTTADPDAWILVVRADNGVPPTTVELRWRLVRLGRRCVVVTTRSII